MGADISTGGGDITQPSQIDGVAKSGVLGLRFTLEVAEIQLVANVPEAVLSSRIMLIFVGRLIPAKGALPSPAESIIVSLASIRSMRKALLERESVEVTTWVGRARALLVSVEL